MPYDVGLLGGYAGISKEGKWWQIGLGSIPQVCCASEIRLGVAAPMNSNAPSLASPTFRNEFFY